MLVTSPLATITETSFSSALSRTADFDEEVIDICKGFLPDHSQGAFEDKRSELHHADARDYLAECGYEKKQDGIFPHTEMIEHQKHSLPLQ